MKAMLSLLEGTNNVLGLDLSFRSTQYSWFGSTSYLTVDVKRTAPCSSVEDLTLAFAESCLQSNPMSRICYHSPCCLGGQECGSASGTVPLSA